MLARARAKAGIGMGRLTGRVAIITGGAGGIGAAAAELFCEEECRVVLVDNNAGALAEVARRIRGRRGKAEILELTADVSAESAATSIVAATLDAYGSLDILVNNAGIRAYEPLAEAKAETWQQILSTNLLSYAFLAREALPALRKSGRGSIVNISSTHAFNPRAGMGQYDVAKAGIISLTRTLAFEEVGRKVRVNAVCPGLTLTPFHVRRAEASGRTEQDLRTEKTGHNIQQRWADPREIAYPILWLASDEASFMTAATIMVDGGTHV
jgi:NAD(P)-dependent dehydrogenase (short-subunit alcohol dehydrogenase family)